MFSGSSAHCPTALVTLTSSAWLVPVSRLMSGCSPPALRILPRFSGSLANSAKAPTTFTNTYNMYHISATVTKKICSLLRTNFVTNIYLQPRLTSSGWLLSNETRTSMVLSSWKRLTFSAQMAHFQMAPVAAASRSLLLALASSLTRGSRPPYLRTRSRVSFSSAHCVRK